MKAALPLVLSAVTALAAIASVTALTIVGKVDGETAVALLSAVIGGGLVHSSRASLSGTP